MPWLIFKSDKEYEVRNKPPSEGERGVHVHSSSARDWRKLVPTFLRFGIKLTNPGEKQNGK